MNIVQQIEAEETSRLTTERSVPDFAPGDTLRVNVRVVEGNRERVQAFEGVADDWCVETEKLLDEYLSILKRIAELNEILASPERLLDVIREELQAIRDQYGDERKTEIQASHLDLTIEDLINEEDLVVTISHQGYAKTQPLDSYQAQKRGGRGRAATRPLIF